MDEIKQVISDLVGDTPVAQQIDAALRTHQHDYPTREEYEALKAEVKHLINLIGDTSVAEQIYAALNG